MVLFTVLGVILHGFIKFQLKFGYIKIYFAFDKSTLI